MNNADQLLVVLMTIYFIIITVILALAPAIAGLWWWRKGAGIQILLFAVFVSIASLAMLPSEIMHPALIKDPGTAAAVPGWLLYALDATDSFTTLLILPLMYDILVRITKFHRSKKTDILWFLPPLLVGALNTAMYFNAFLFLQVIAFFYSLIYIIRRYNNSIESYYVDLEFTDCRYVRNIANTMMVAVVVFYIVLIMQRKTANDYFIITLLYLIVSFIVIWVIGRNLSRMEGNTAVFYLQESTFSNEEIADLALNNEIELTASSGAYPDHDEGATDAVNQSQYIEDVIKKWENSGDKPYLKEGITISDVADQMGISSRILSTHLNHAMQQNFNSWINDLRIENAKSMFRQDTSLCASYVAIKCGFADTAMLSKNFKRVTGLTITEYKRSF